jgi:hypothetical protein
VVIVDGAAVATWCVVESPTVVVDVGVASWSSVVLWSSLAQSMWSFRSDSSSSSVKIGDVVVVRCH